MVYIVRDGTVRESQPWSVARFKGMIAGFFAFFVMFFKTLFDLNSNSSSGTSATGNRWGGGGGGGGGGPPPPGGPRQRPIGRMMTLRDCTIPGGG